MRSFILAIVLFTYVLVIGGYILYWNHAGGGMVQNWYHEYMGEDGKIHGSGKWRVNLFEPDKNSGFQSFAFWFGTWVYPFSLLSALIFILKGSAQQRWTNRLLLFGAAIISLGVLTAFLYLRIFTAVNYFGH